VEAQYDDVADAYWRYYRLSTGSREERLAAEEFFWAWDAVWDAVHYAPMLRSSSRLISCGMSRNAAPTESRWR
jgi:hypothetical protein